MAAMTLEEIKKGMADKVFSQIVDIFLRQSAILSVLPFDDCVSASGGGSTMKYKYLRKVLPATAQFRKIGGSYTASAATKQECEASLAIMGGSVQMDRVLNKAAGNWDNLAYQIEEHIKAVVSLFHYTLINGDAATTAETAALSRPDMAEIMPGICPRVLRRLAGQMKTDIIAGGMIERKEDILAALKAGAKGVSTSSVPLWNS